MSIMIGGYEIFIVSYGFCLLLLGVASLFFSLYLFGKETYLLKLEKLVAHTFFVVHKLYIIYTEQFHHKEKTKEILFFDKERFFAKNTFSLNELRTLGKKELNTITYMQGLVADNSITKEHGGSFPSGLYRLRFFFAISVGVSALVLFFYLLSNG